MELRNVRIHASLIPRYPHGKNKSKDEKRIYTHGGFSHDPSLRKKIDLSIKQR